MINSDRLFELYVAFNFRQSASKFVASKNFKSQVGSVCMYANAIFEKFYNEINICFICNDYLLRTDFTNEQKSPVIFVSLERAREQKIKLDYLVKLGIFALILGEKLKLQTLIFDEKMHRIDELAKGFLPNFISFDFLEYTKNEEAKLIYKYGKNFCLSLFFGYKLGEISIELLSIIFELEIEKTKDFLNRYETEFLVFLDKNNVI